MSEKWSRAEAKRLKEWMLSDCSFGDIFWRGTALVCCFPDMVFMGVDDESTKWFSLDSASCLWVRRDGELGGALRFKEHTGHNWDSLDEQEIDLAKIPPVYARWKEGGLINLEERPPSVRSTTCTRPLIEFKAVRVVPKSEIGL